MEDKVEKNTQKEQQKEKRLRKNEEVLRELQDNMKHNNRHIIRIPEADEEHGTEKLIEKVMMENFPNVMIEKVTQIQDTQSPNQEEPRASGQDGGKGRHTVPPHTTKRRT